ncbi:hypothetical protein D9M68_930050 [compost metagenome]
MLHGATEAEAVRRAWGLVVGLGGDGIPAGEPAFPVALHDQPQAGDDGVPFQITGTTPSIQPRTQAGARRCRGSTFGPGGYTQDGGQLARCRCQGEASGGALGLAAGAGR